MLRDANWNAEVAKRSAEDNWCNFKRMLAKSYESGIPLKRLDLLQTDLSLDEPKHYAIDKEKM